MDQQKKHDIALMRYSAIATIISDLKENYSSLEAFYRDVSKKDVITPNRPLSTFSPTTIDKWYLKYRKR